MDLFLLKKKLFGSWFSPVEALMALMVLVLAVVFYAFPFDDDGIFMYNMAAGQYTGFSLIDWHFLGYIGFAEIFKILYDTFPRYAWIPIALTISMLWGLYIVLVSIREIIFSHRQSNFLLRFLQLSVALCFTENFVNVSNTRVSLIFCGIALFNLAFTYSPSRNKILGNGILFLVGLLYRPESAAGMLALVSVSYFLYKFQVLDYIRRLWLPVLFTGIFFLVSGFYWRFSTDFVVKVEPEIEYQVMMKNLIPISEMKTSQDSIKYQVGARGMWFDPQIVDADFLRSMLQSGNDFDMSRIGSGFSALGTCFSRYPFFQLMFPLLVLFTFIYAGRKRGLALLLFHLFLFIVLFYLSYRQLLRDRHILPFLQISFLATLYYLFSSSPKISRLGVAILSIGLSIGLSYNFILLTRYNIQQASIVLCSEKIMADFESKTQRRIVVVTNTAYYMFHHNLGIYNQNYDKNVYVMYDLFTYSLVKRNQDYLSQMCACDARRPPEFFKWLSNEGALYAADNGRFELTSRYMKIIYGVDVRFEKDSAYLRKDCDMERDLGTVELRRVFVK